MKLSRGPVPWKTSHRGRNDRGNRETVSMTKVAALRTGVLPGWVTRAQAPLPWGVGSTDHAGEV